MPRMAGVSLSSTEELSFLRPSPRATTAWLSLNPVVLFTSFTVTVLPLVSVLSLAMFEFLRARPRRELFERFAAQPCNHRRILELAEARERRPHDVVRVGRSERLRQDVRDAGRFDDRAHGASRDDARAVGRRLEQHGARAELADDAVRNRRAGERHANQVFLRRFDALLDGRGHFLRLADA